MARFTCSGDSGLNGRMLLSRRYELRLKPPSHLKSVPLRAIRAAGSRAISRARVLDSEKCDAHLSCADIGSLVKTKGIITRCSEVKPLVEVGAASEGFPAMESCVSRVHGALLS